MMSEAQMIAMGFVQLLMSFIIITATMGNIALGARKWPYALGFAFGVFLSFNGAFLLMGISLIEEVFVGS